MADSDGAGRRAAAARLVPLLDLTSLNDDDTPDTIAALCNRAVTPVGSVAAVCVYPRFVAQAKRLLAGGGVRIATVANFPAASASPGAVAEEIASAVAAGADEIDVVIHFFKSHPVPESVLESAREASEGKILKVILETSLLTRDEKMMGCTLSKAAGADYVKTSTGFAGGGATVDDVRLMRETVGPEIGVKASGGIRTREDAQAMVAAGATRLGASAGVKIVRGQVSESKGY